MNLPVVVQLLLAFVLGAFIGLERESHELADNKENKKYSSEGFVGVRTFSLITSLGSIAGLLFDQYLGLFLTINAAFILLIISSYIISSRASKDVGITTEIALIYSFIIGQLITLGVLPIQIIIALTILLVLVLSQKQKIKSLVSGMARGEFQDLIGYAIIALVILPFLPNQSYTLSDIPNIGIILSSYGIELGSLAQVNIFNPFNLWMIVALITGIDIIAHILERTIGQKSGWIITSIVGGVVSSTAVTQSLAQKSKKIKSGAGRLAAAAVFASTASYIKLFIILGTLNSALLVASTKFILIIITTGIICGLVLIGKKTRTQEHLQETKDTLRKATIFTLKPALVFVLVFTAIKIITQFSLTLFGQSAFLITSSLAAISGMNAVIINFSQLAGTTISMKTAVLGLILASTTNLFGKLVYTYFQGNRKFAIKFIISALFIISLSFIGLT